MYYRPTKRSSGLKWGKLPPGVQEHSAKTHFGSTFNLAIVKFQLNRFNVYGAT